MLYQANESDILSTIRDFEAICEYIGSQKPLLTPKNDLSKKACYALNNIMTHPTQDAKTTDLIAKYPTINLYYKIAYAAGLLKHCKAAKGKSAIGLSEAYEKFAQMNRFSKYLFIFLTWMLESDIDELYSNERFIGSFGPEIIDITIAGIGQLSETGKISPEEQEASSVSFYKILPRIMFDCSELLCHLRDFGLLAFDERVVLDKQDIRKIIDFDMNVRGIRVTPFGAALSVACDSRRFSWVNKYEHAVVVSFYLLDSVDDSIELFEEDYENNPPGSDGFLTPFLSCFPDNTIDSAAINSLLFPKVGNLTGCAVYEFKVQLNPDCYRIIQCAGQHTFEDLHFAIIEAFAFDDDHLYSFFLNGKRWSRGSINSPYCDDEPYADETFIREARLAKGQKILYLFDFGDCWEFTITVLSIDDVDSPPELPTVVNAVGDAPEQYPSWE